MKLFRRKAANQEPISPADYIREYNSRQIADPGSLYPHVERALDRAFMFVGFGARFAFKGDLDPRDVDQFNEKWAEAVSEFRADLAEINDAEAAMNAIRMADPEKHVLAVHFTSEHFIRSFIHEQHHEALAFQAMTQGIKEQFRENRDLAEYHRRAAEEMKAKLAAAVRALCEERPDQFEEFGISEGNLASLGLEDLMC